MNEASQALSRAMNWAAVMPEIVLLTMACVIALVLFALSMVFAIFLMRRGSGFLAPED